MTEKDRKTPTDVASYYEKYWSSEGFSPFGSMYPELERLLLRHVRPGAACLDVGCGDGRTAGLWLQNHGCDYLGVDVSTAAVEMARSIGLKAQAIEAATSLPFADEAFDMVLCLEVFEHLFEPHVAAAELLRVLRPGGVLVASVPNTAYWRRRAELAVIGRWDPIGDTLSVAQPWRDPHIRFFTPATLRRMLELAGYVNVEVGGHGGAFLRDLPWVGSRVRSWNVSSVYDRAQRAFPDLLALRLSAVATKG